MRKTYTVYGNSLNTAIKNLNDLRYDHVLHFKW